MERSPRDYGESTSPQDPTERQHLASATTPADPLTGATGTTSDASATPSTAEWERWRASAGQETATWVGAHGDSTAPSVGDDSALTVPLGGERVIELREEQLVARKELREVGEVELRTVVEEVPGRLEVEAYREEIEVEHVPMGQVVTERMSPWEEADALVVPVYEEQLVVVKRLYLREHLRIRRVGTRETRLFEDTLRRERLVIEDPAGTGLVHEQYPSAEGQADSARAAGEEKAGEGDREEGGFLHNLVRKALQ